MINKIGIVSTNQTCNNSHKKNSKTYSQKNISFGTNIDGLKSFVSLYHSFLNKKSFGSKSFIEKLEILSKDGKDRSLALDWDKTACDLDDRYKSRFEYTLSFTNAKDKKILIKSVLVNDGQDYNKVSTDFPHFVKRIKRYLNPKKLDKIERNIDKEITANENAKLAKQAAEKLRESKRQNDLKRIFAK